MRTLKSLTLGAALLVLGGQAAPQGCETTSVFDAEGLAEPSVPQGFNGVGGGGAVIDGFAGFRSGGVDDGFAGHAANGRIEEGFAGGGAGGLCDSMIGFSLEIVHCLVPLLDQAFDASGQPGLPGRAEVALSTAEARRQLEQVGVQICPAFDAEFAAAAGPNAQQMAGALSTCFDRLAQLSCNQLFGGQAAEAACGDLAASFSDFAESEQSLEADSFGLAEAAVRGEL